MDASLTFSSALQNGTQLMRAGDFHAAHDQFEAGWRVEQGVPKRALQVLTLWATALLHSERGNQVGARRVMERALERQAEIEDTKSPIALNPLLDAMLATWQAIRAGEKAPAPQWEPELVLLPEESFDLSVSTLCPYCGEPVEVVSERREDAVVRYVEDCPVCCRPWEVTVSRDGISLARGDG